ncbi:MAG: methyltransferase domain-containing protein [Acidobacteria bacterium]|nr:methyltransferase domain-containing protein [Acidobacteriota bacterium]MBI1982841.1 methyltransferase domain-containing protein [Acidobacteriota bacterium]
MSQDQKQQQLREEFNRWAVDGRGSGLEDHHRPIVEPTLALMDLQPTDRVLDVGCGTGWLCRMIAPQLSQGFCAGIDVSDAMVERAQAEGTRLPNVQFLAGGADKIPWQDDFFTKVISVESAYYWPEPAAGISEIHRVLGAGGSAWILINYYLENPYAHHWGAQLAVPTHLLSTDTWMRIFCDAGFANVGNRRIPDLSPTPETYTGSAFKDAAQMRRFKETGALLVCGTKPSTGQCHTQAT